MLQKTPRSTRSVAGLAITLALIAFSGCLGALSDNDLVPEGATVAIEHALGTTDVPVPATRIVSLEWSYTEVLLALGIQPVGVADVDGYETLVATTPSLDETVTDVGTRQEPNLETITALEPDLIIGVKFRHEDLYASLSRIAPTIVFDPWPETGDQLGRMRETVATIGAATGHTIEAQEALDVLRARVDDGRASIAAGGHTGSPFVLAQVLQPQYGALRLFQDHHAAVALIEELGLENAWEDEPADNGFSTTGVEALQRVDDARFLYVPSSGTDLSRFEDNPTWQNLTFVQNDWTYDLSGAWLLPGPLSGIAFIDKVVAALGAAVPANSTKDTAAANNTTADAVPEEGPTRIIAHDMGGTEITGTPKRIVALEWNFVEGVLALGMQPVGVADLEAFDDWVEIGIELDHANITDVGTRSEPNLETITELKPDLILAIKFRHEDIYDELSAIAPTLIYEAFPPVGAPASQFDKMEFTFKQVAKALWRQEAGTTVLQSMDDTLAAAKAELGTLDADGRDVLLSQIFTMDGTPLLRVFTDNSIAVEVAHRLGLNNAWPADYEIYGFSTVNMEALASVQHADFFYVAQQHDNPVEDQWTTNPVWNSYQFVKEDRVYALGHDAWLFGAPLSIEHQANVMLEHYRG